MARKDEKPMMPVSEMPNGHLQCAADAACRKPGRMYVDGLNPQDRLCVYHFYIALDRGARWIEPPRRMLGVVAKPVSGND